jgi:hypothetical protein
MPARTSVSVKTDAGVEPGLAVAGDGDVGVGVVEAVAVGVCGGVDVCGVVEVCGVVVVAGVGEGCGLDDGGRGSRTMGTGTTSPVRIPARRWTVSPIS